MAASAPMNEKVLPEVTPPTNCSVPCGVDQSTSSPLPAIDLGERRRLRLVVEELGCLEPPRPAARPEARSITEMPTMRSTSRYIGYGSSSTPWITL